MTLLDLKDLELHLWEAAHIITGPIEPYRVCLSPLFLRECPDEKIKIFQLKG